MAINLYTNRADTPEKAEYWKVDKNYKKVDEIVYQKKPSGVFYCCEKSSQATTSQRAGSMMSFENDTMGIMTRDAIDDIQNHDIVLYRGKYWMVDQVQKVAIKSNLYYRNRPSYEIYLQIRSIND